jgi:hypothetical protein
MTVEMDSSNAPITSTTIDSSLLPSNLEENTAPTVTQDEAPAVVTTSPSVTAESHHVISTPNTPEPQRRTTKPLEPPEVISSVTASGAIDVDALMDDAAFLLQPSPVSPPTMEQERVASVPSPVTTAAAVVENDVVLVRPSSSSTPTTGSAITAATIARVNNAVSNRGRTLVPTTPRASAAAVVDEGTPGPPALYHPSPPSTLRCINPASGKFFLWFHLFV